MLCAACGGDDAPCDRVLTSYQRAGLGPPPLELLLVVDRSVDPSAQASLAAALPRWMEVIRSGDVNGDGDTLDPEDFSPFDHVRAGVITTDMGTGGHALPSCPASDFGDDGLLQTANATGEACIESVPPFLTWGPSLTTPEELVQGLGCIALVGSDGCAIEQPLEAALKALTFSSAPPWAPADYRSPGSPDAPEGLTRPFFRNTRGHGDRANDGFLSDLGILTIVTLTDDDDCSFFDPALFDPSGPYADTPLGLRCAEHREALHPVERYVNGLLQLREPFQLVFVPIAGIPVELASPPGERPDWERLASPDCETRDSRLCPRVDPSDSTRLAASCERAGGLRATPPNRLLEVARGLEARGAGVTVHSICDGRYEDALLGAIDAVRRATEGACLPHPLPVEPDGRASCELRVTMPEGLDCDREGFAPRLDEEGAPMREHGRAVCVMQQLAPDPSALEGVGWFYDTFTAERERACAGGKRIAYAGVRPPNEGWVELECSTPIAEVVPGYGMPCDPEDADACRGLQTRVGEALACDPSLGRCGVPCESREECRDADLDSFLCPGEGADAGDPPRFCVDPTCG